ncbi:MAG: Asp-tRNA(Asn)/Glu-tRNA(Gln) amidotransferase subunit GatC [Gammaproteobacteria bacterium]|nr:MAG: Asp-tRNA(Asn)/Glu-tRNA(Gln) amidotransferase subunit GatC [Gammaproteobacteria bacterium]
MALSRQDVEHIADLARLEIGDDEIADMVAKLSQILGMVAELGAADTSGVEPMAHPLEMAQRLRPDEVTESDHRELYQQNAPDVVDGLYRVPKVIE